MTNDMRPEHAMHIIEFSITELCEYIRDAFTPHPNPYMPDRDPFTHISDDDTDYIPAALDLLTLLTRARLADDAPERCLALIDATINCSLDPDDPDNATDAPCSHQTALDCNPMLIRHFAPDYEHCPHDDRN